MRKLGISLSLIAGFAYSYSVVCKDESYDYLQTQSLKQTPLFLMDKFRFLGNEAVLIFNCSQEKIIKRLSRLLPHGFITNLYSTQNIQNLQIDFPKSEYENVNFIQGSIEDLKYPHQYDLIFAFDSLILSDLLNKDLEKIHLALKLSGAVALSFFFWPTRKF